MGAQHDPFVGLAGIVVEKRLGLGRRFLGRDGERRRRESRGDAGEARRRLGRYAEGGNALAALAARRACHDMAGQRPRDQKAHGAMGARHVVLAAAMDGAGGEHQLVAHQHDAALDVCRMRVEFIGRAAAEVDHLGRESGRGRSDGAHQRMAGGHRSARQAQRRRLGPPPAIGHGNRAACVGRRGRAHPLAQECEGALLALGAGQPAAAVADVVEVAPQSGIGQDLGGGFAVETELRRFSHPACPRAARERPRPASRARGRGDGRRPLRRGWRARTAARPGRDG